MLQPCCLILFKYHSRGFVKTILTKWLQFFSDVLHTKADTTTTRRNVLFLWKSFWIKLFVHMPKWLQYQGFWSTHV